MEKFERNWERLRGKNFHYVKIVCIQSCSGPYFPAFALNSISPYSVRMRGNTEQNNSEYGQFLRSVFYKQSQI